MFHSLPLFLHMKIPVSINLTNKLTNLSIQSDTYDKHVDSRRGEEKNIYNTHMNQSSNIHCISKRMTFMITNGSLVYLSSGKILYRHVFTPNISTYMQLVPCKYLQNIRNKALICYHVSCLTQAIWYEFYSSSGELECTTC